MPKSSIDRRSLFAAGASGPDKPTEWDVPLRDRGHVFPKRHRIIVQIQSSWFPLIDRNPQTFGPGIYDAKACDFKVRDPDGLRLARDALADRLASGAGELNWRGTHLALAEP